MKDTGLILITVIVWIWRLTDYSSQSQMLSLTPNLFVLRVSILVRGSVGLLVVSVDIGPVILLLPTLVWNGWQSLDIVRWYVKTGTDSQSSFDLQCKNLGHSIHEKFERKSILTFSDLWVLRLFAKVFSRDFCRMTGALPALSSSWGQPVCCILPPMTT